MITSQMIRKTVFLFLVCITGLISCKKEKSEVEVTRPALNEESNIFSKALPHAKNQSGEVAYQWFSLIADITRTRPYVPPQSSRIFAYTGLALYESVVPGMPSYQSMYTQLTGDIIDYDKKKDYYWPASANAAIARIVTQLMAYYGPNSGLTAIQQLEAHYNNQFLTEISPEQLQNSRNFGIYVADKVLNWSISDGTFVNGNFAPCPPYVPLGTPGAWVPTPPSFFPAAGFCQGNLRTFIPNIKNTLLPPPPPVYSTQPGSAFYEAALQVYNMRNNMTVDDMKISESWQDRVGINYNSPTHVIKLTSKLAAKEKLDLEISSVLFAKQSMAMWDAIISVFHSKFSYNLERPVTYIRNVLNHPSWSSYVFTPQHPSYASTMVCAATAGFTIASKYFGNQYTFTDDVHDFLYGSWTYHSFDEAIQDAKRARTVSGTNFVFAADAGMQLGKDVGNTINNLPFKKP